MKPVILLGSGGHARVLAGMLRRLNVDVLGVTDPQRTRGDEFLGLPVLGDDSEILKYAPDQVELVNGIGSLPGDHGFRMSLFVNFKQQGFEFKTLIDNRAFVAEDSELAEGVQVMAGAIVQTGAKIAVNSIINSGAIVEHDCRIGGHAHIAPGAVLSGSVLVGHNVHVGTGASVIQGIRIGDASVIGAGSVVIRDVGVRQMVYPARSHLQDLQ